MRLRKFDTKTASDGAVIFDLDLTAVDMHDVFDDGQPQTSATDASAAGFIDPIKTLE